MQAAPQLAEPSVPPPSVFPAPLPARKSHASLWIGGSLVLVVICGVIATVLWTQRANLPGLSGLLATPTPTQTARPNATPPGGLIEMVWAQHNLVADESTALA